MKFELIDRVIERGEDHLVAVKCVTAAEEYLADHFPTFPVLPGVLMVEALVQAGRALIEPASDGPFVLGRVRAMKFGHFVRPGDTLRVEVRRTGREGVEHEFKATATIGPDKQAAAGRFTLRPARIGCPERAESRAPIPEEPQTCRP